VCLSSLSLNVYSIFLHVGYSIKDLSTVHFILVKSCDTSLINVEIYFRFNRLFNPYVLGHDILISGVISVGV
jgi:hypothetical protein